MTTHDAELVTEPNDLAEGVEITWDVPYVWSKPMPATHTSPAEGGLELDGEPRPVSVRIYDLDGDGYKDTACSEGDELERTIRALFPVPTEDECWEAAGEHNAARMEDTRY